MDFIAMMCLKIRGKCSKGVLVIISGLLLFLTDCPYRRSTVTCHYSMVRSDRGFEPMCDNGKILAIYEGHKNRMFTKYNLY